MLPDLRRAACVPSEEVKAGDAIPLAVSDLLRQGVELVFGDTLVKAWQEQG
jgi:hypothetical protein